MMMMKVSSRVGFVFRRRSVTSYRVPQTNDGVFFFRLPARGANTHARRRARVLLAREVFSAGPEKSRWIRPVNGFFFSCPGGFGGIRTRQHTCALLGMEDAIDQRQDELHKNIIALYSLIKYFFLMQNIVSENYHDESSFSCPALPDLSST